MIHEIPAATADKDGLMSSEDKSRLGMLSTFNELKREMFDAVYPVGSIYITVDKTFDPARNFGGTWETLPEGYSLVTFEDGAGGEGIPAMPDPGSRLSAVLPEHKHILQYIGWSSSDGTKTTYKPYSAMLGPRGTPNTSDYSKRYLYDCTKYNHTRKWMTTSFPYIDDADKKDLISSDVYSGTGMYVRPTGISVKVWRRTK